MPSTAQAIEKTVYAGLISIHAKLDEYCDNSDAEEAAREYCGGTSLVDSENAEASPKPSPQLVVCQEPPSALPAG